jgi:hypothetical protein
VTFLLAVTAFSYQNLDTGQITVTLNVVTPEENLNRVLTVNNNSTAFDVLNSTYEVEYSDSDFGVFVTSINGVVMNDTHSWIYLVNSRPPEVAANRFDLSNRDNVTFRYISNEKSMEFFN